MASPSVPHTDSIFALSTAPGRAGVAVIRLSGSRSRLALEALTAEPAPPPRKAMLRSIFGDRRSVVDQGLVLFFPGPSSYTGEDVAELHLHGGRAILARVTDLLVAEGLRPAQRGEFTRRAVENGKFDLTRAEAIADLVDAETEAQRRQALRQFGGEFGRLCERWRDALIRATSWAEAAIDFADDELPTDLLEQARRQANALSEEIRSHLQDDRGEILREGVHLTVIGPPNAGKSSLVNALARRDVAIVAESAGTTRDVIEVHLDLGGYPVIVSDTAGLRETTEAVEAEGVRRALARAEAADLVLLLLDGSRPGEAAAVLREGSRPPDLVAWNKADLDWPEPQRGLLLSLKTGEGVEELMQALQAAVERRLERPGEAPVVTRERHRQSLLSAVGSLDRASSQGNAELMAEDLRLATRAVGQITGRVDVEEILDAIFHDFCIGK